MRERSFLDTNILVYTDDAGAPDKCERAIELIEAGLRSNRGVISTQVLQEYFVASTRKLGVDAAVARQRVQFFSRLRVVQNTAQDVLGAIDLHRLHQLSFWDALIIQAAQNTDCAVLLSEDMQHGQVINGVTVHNPFH